MLSFHPMHRRTSKGYTIPELLVSIMIFAILTTVILAGFKRGSLSDDLRNSALTFSGHLRRVQNLAMVGQALTTGSVPPGGYGISIDFWTGGLGKYTIYADTQRDLGSGCVTLTNPDDANSQYDCQDVKVESGTVSLAPYVIINRIKVGSNTEEVKAGTSGGNVINMAFKPPKPIPIVDQVSGETVRIELRHTQTNATRVITIVGASGQISESIGTF